MNENRRAVLRGVNEMTRQSVETLERVIKQENQAFLSTPERLRKNRIVPSVATSMELVTAKEFLKAAINEINAAMENWSVKL